jgi:hypothetical protein
LGKQFSPLKLQNVEGGGQTGKGMIKLSLSDKAFERMAQMLEGPENPETPAIPGEEEAGSGLPKVI